MKSSCCRSILVLIALSLCVPASGCPELPPRIVCPEKTRVAPPPSTVAPAGSRRTTEIALLSAPCSRG